MVRARISNLLGQITLFAVICCFGMVGLCVNTALALSGSGTQQDPWRIQSLEDFNDFAADPNYWDDYTRLETDVNLAGRVYERAVIAWDTNSSSVGFQGTEFTGIFDGNDHKTTNLTIDDGGAGNDYLGLFGYIGEYGEVKNLGIEGGSVSGGSRYVGGLMGWHSGKVENCYSNGDVSGSYHTGGLVGKSSAGFVWNCHSTGDVSGDRYVGGLVGDNSGGVSNCYSTGNVRGENWVGGLVGKSSDSVSNCYSTGDVSGNRYFGGLVGTNWASISNCFWDTDIQTHGVTESIGVNNGTTTNVHGLPTSQLHQQSTFTNWDFINVWDIGENQTYPYLRKYSPANLNKDHKVDLLDIRILCEQWLEEK